MIDPHIVLLGAALEVAGSAAYLRDTLRGTSQPNRATFALWTVIPLIAAAAELAGGVGWAALPALGAGIMPGLILVASFVRGGAQWKLGRFDYGCASLSLLAVVLWEVSGNGNVAISLSLAADLLASLPTLIKCWTHPHTETAWAYAAGFVNASTGILAARNASFTALGFNVYLVIMCAILTGLILWPRRAAVDSPPATA